MKKSVCSIVLSSALLVSGTAMADGWRVLPVLNDNSLKFEPTLALSVSHVAPEKSGLNSARAYGIDLNFNCGLIQDPQNRIRTHLNISHSDKKGLEVMAYELSPRYTVPLGSGLSVGVGPSLAVYRLDSSGHQASHFGVGVAAGVNYRAGAFYAGADVRSHDTQTKRGVDYDNLSFGVKVGVNF